MRIGELSSVTGASARSLRHYEKLGLIDSVREPNGYRNYSAASVATVQTIRELLGLGFPTSLIEEILPCTTSAGPTGDCSALRAKVTDIRDELDVKVHQLAATRDVLTEYLGRPDAEGPAGR